MGDNETVFLEMTYVFFSVGPKMWDQTGIGDRGTNVC